MLPFGERDSLVFATGGGQDRQDRLNLHEFHFASAAEACRSLVNVG